MQPEAPRRVASIRPRENPINAVANHFRSADGRWFVHNPRGGSGGWEKFLGVAGRPDLVTDPRFATGKERRANARAKLAAELGGGVFQPCPSTEIARRLDAADLVWAPFQTPADVDADPQVAAAGAFVEVDDGQGGTLPLPGQPCCLPWASRRPLALARPAWANTPARCWARSAIRRPRSRRCSRRRPWPDFYLPRETAGGGPRPEEGVVEGASYDR